MLTIIGIIAAVTATVSATTTIKDCCVICPSILQTLPLTSIFALNRTVYLYVNNTYAYRYFPSTQEFTPLTEEQHQTLPDHGINHQTLFRNLITLYLPPHPFDDE